MYDSRDTCILMTKLVMPHTPQFLLLYSFFMYSPLLTVLSLRATYYVPSKLLQAYFNLLLESSAKSYRL